MAGLKIGEVARKAGVNLQTVYFYERRGLLPKPSRTASNHRLYNEEAVRRIRFIKRAQELGFTLEEIRELLSLRAVQGPRCTAVRRKAEAKLEAVKGKIRSLESIRRALENLIAQCRGNAPPTACPILEALEAEGDHGGGPASGAPPPAQ